MTDLTREERIVWEENISRLDYVREIVVEAGTRRRPIRWYEEGRRVGYAVLEADTPHETGRPGTYIRRLFFLKDYDRDNDPTGTYSVGAPSEAVDPRTVRPGRAGVRADRAWGCDAAE